MRRKVKGYDIGVALKIGVINKSNNALELQKIIEQKNDDLHQKRNTIIFNNGSVSIDVDVSIEEETVWSVDLFTKDPYEALAVQIKDLLRAEGYVVQEGPELYESDTKYHHISFDVTGREDIGMYAEADEDG